MKMKGEVTVDCDAWDDGGFKHGLSMDAGISWGQKEWQFCYGSQTVLVIIQEQLPCS